MKLNRWFVITLLAASGLSVLLAVSYLWITWPVRTARDFAELLNQKELVHMRIAHRFQHPERELTGMRADPQARSFVDVLLGRQRFALIPIPNDGSGPLITFQAERGTILYE